MRNIYGVVKMHRLNICESVSNEDAPPSVLANLHELSVVDTSEALILPVARAKAVGKDHQCLFLLTLCQILSLPVILTKTNVDYNNSLSISVNFLT